MNKEQFRENERKVVTGFGVVGIGVLAALLNLACDNGGSADFSPTLNLGDHNVEWVRIDDEDVTGDTIVDIRDARAHIGQKSIDWLPDLDKNFDFIINDKDVNIVKRVVCKLPVEPKNDLNGDGHVTSDDVNIVARHANNERVRDDFRTNANARIDQLEHGGWTLDEKGGRVFPTYFDDGPMSDDPFCDATPTPEANSEQ